VSKWGGSEEGLRRDRSGGYKGAHRVSLLRPVRTADHFRLSPSPPIFFFFIPIFPPSLPLRLSPACRYSLPPSSLRTLQVFAYMTQQGFFCQVPFDPTHTEIGSSLCFPSLSCSRALLTLHPARRVRTNQQDRRAAVVVGVFRSGKEEKEQQETHL
jgi:hypothetical protein